jgi:hypothetical protein
LTRRPSLDVAFVRLNPIQSAACSGYFSSLASSPGQWQARRWTPSSQQRKVSWLRWITKSRSCEATHRRPTLRRAPGSPNLVMPMQIGSRGKTAGLRGFSASFETTMGSAMAAIILQTAILGSLSFSMLTTNLFCKMHSQPPVRLVSLYPHREISTGYNGKKRENRRSSRRVQYNGCSARVNRTVDRVFGHGLVGSGLSD